MQVENGYDFPASHERHGEFALDRRDLAYVTGLAAHVISPHCLHAPHGLAGQSLARGKANGSRQILAVADRMRNAQRALVVWQEQGVDLVVDDLANHRRERDHQRVEIEGMGCRRFGSLEQDSEFRITVRLWSARRVAQGSLGHRRVYPTACTAA